MASKSCFHFIWAWALPLTLFLLPLLSQSHLNSISKSFQFIKNLEGSQKGQKVEGLDQLKLYLEKFGYLPHPSDTTENNGGGIDDSFDDLLESAIKTYQFNYHLNVTGALDPDTVRQMMIPRCGMADIAHDGKSSMRVGRERRLGSTSFLVVSHYSFFYGAPRWSRSKLHLTYGFLPGVQVIDMQTLRSICSRAFGRWAKVSEFTFEEVEDYDSADLKIGFFSEDHGDGRPFDGPGGILAHAFAPMIGQLHFDADENWGTHQEMDAVDVESVAEHEMGHLLGLGHSSDKNAIMYPSIPPGVRKVTLQEDDIKGIHALYNL